MTEIINFLAENRRWIRAAIWIFVVSAAIGGIVFFIKPNLLESILNIFSDKFGGSPALDWQLTREIFTQNVTASAIAMFGGVILGLMPIVVIATNGFLLGFVVLSLITLNGGGIINSLLLVLLGVGPHGVLEIPSFLVASAMGIRLGIEWLMAPAAGTRWRTLGANLIRASKYFIYIVLALALAAVIEVFISGKFVDKL